MILAPLAAPKFIKPAVILVLALNCVDSLVSELCTLPSPTSDAVVPDLIVAVESLSTFPKPTSDFVVPLLILDIEVVAASPNH